MTTTAFDDQFTVGTQPIEPVREPMSREAILRRNVADLELALKQQTERAEAAEAELLAIREDNHSMMLEIHNLRIERDKLLAALELFMDRVDEPPESNCSCHLSPPCNDCVEYSGLREAFSDAHDAIAKAEG